MRKVLIQAFIEMYDRFESSTNREGMDNVDDTAKLMLTDDEYLEFTEGYDKDEEPLIGWESQLD